MALMQASQNGFFKLTDTKVSGIMGLPIHPTFWSRHYEYPWALQYAEPGQVVADMGCGWHDRPFKDALSFTCKRVWAVDAHEGIFGLKKRPRLIFVQADITKEIEAIDEASLDRVFCISVLEDIRDTAAAALTEFARCVKPDGLVVLTCDSQYDYDKPLAQYPGVPIPVLEKAVEDAGLEFVGDVDWSKEGALFHEGFNLAVVHVVLRRKA